MSDEMRPELYNEALRGTIIRRLDKMSTEQMLDLLGHLILKERDLARGNVPKPPVVY